jgi:hypothetical protein
MSSSKGDVNLLTAFQRSDVQQRLTGVIKFPQGSWKCDYCGFVTRRNRLMCCENRLMSG